ncbi:signal peptidase II [Gemella sp. GH3]|uniref:signal peptidase II n=1 Tax=unclassified Gemella TaxID=2624949 RepID=UPI0015D0431B|nr:MULTISPECIES: signal peptidase II [unclassified Gemella]MBF0713202.1 signal peptidase II [Gemella sp. GH3.1]NYS50154.1 signal peptidase II [Gemella sp. GH3]
MFLIFLFAIIFVAVDQISKYFILTNMTLGESITIINNFFFITSHRNRGAAWGILQDSRLFFIITTILFLVAIFIYILKSKKNFNKFDYIIFSLIIGGAIGNFIDRLRLREVVDFLDFNILGYNFPIFNFADTFICIGALLLAIKIYREE